MMCTTCPAHRAAHQWHANSAEVVSLSAIRLIRPTDLCFRRAQAEMRRETNMRQLPTSWYRLHLRPSVRCLFFLCSAA